jgi:hypothetical protein
MIPYLLAIAGGYLIAQSRKQDTFADGGTILSEDGTFVTLIDESNIGEKVIFDAQKKYIEQRNKIQARAMSSSSDMGEIYEDFESLLKKQLSAENLVSQKILPSKYNDYHFSFINSKSFGKATDKEGAMKLASRLNQMGYKSLIVPSVVVQINMNEPSLGKYIVYTDKPVSEKDLQNLGVYEDGGLLQYCWGGKMADGGMMARGGKIHNLIMQQNDLDPKGFTLVDYDEEKEEWYWEDYKADTYRSGFKSRKDAYEDLNEYLFKDTEYRYEGKEGTMGQKWPDLPTPTKQHSFREY